MLKGFSPRFVRSGGAGVGCSYGDGFEEEDQNLYYSETLRKNIEQGRGKEWETNHSSPERSGRPIILPLRIETTTEYPPEAGLRLELRHPHLAGERDDEPKA
ncbi:hypothetical protein U1Q18_031875 [Sarracenia purpurea var. burkii]